MQRAAAGEAEVSEQHGENKAYRKARAASASVYIFSRDKPPVSGGDGYGFFVAMLSFPFGETSRLASAQLSNFCENTLKHYKKPPCGHGGFWLFSSGSSGLSWPLSFSVPSGAAAFLFAGFFGPGLVHPNLGPFYPAVHQRFGADMQGGRRPHLHAGAVLGDRAELAEHRPPRVS